MAKRRREKMSEGKKNIIAGLIQEYDIKTAADIQEALKAQFGIEIDKRKFELDAPIKAFGTYRIDVKLYQGISGKLAVMVVEK